MAVSAKAVAAGTTAVSASALSIYAIHYFSMPTWTSLKNDSGSDNTYAAKYANHYSRFLVGVANQNNDSWWKWSFTNRYQAKSDSDRGTGFNSGINSWNKLKETCKKAYLAEENVSEGNITADSVNYKETEVWNYCSPLEVKPVVLTASEEISEASYKISQTSNPKWGQVAGVHDKLVSTHTPSNSLFWEMQQRDLSENIDSSHKFFAAQKNLGIQVACQRAYEIAKPSEDSEASSEDSPNKAEILKYCSLKGRE